MVFYAYTDVNILNSKLVLHLVTSFYHQSPRVMHNFVNIKFLFIYFYVRRE